jgi:hypothetical protein
MNYLITIFSINLLFVSCKTQVEVLNCEKDIEKYQSFSYELSNKKLIKHFAGDSIYSANALVKINKEQGTILSMDTLYCYILAICNKESIVKGRFFKDEETFHIINELDLLEFDLKKMNTEINNDSISQKINKYLIGNLLISDHEWRKKLNTENILTFGFKQIAPVNGKFIKQIYQIR